MGENQYIKQTDEKDQSAQGLVNPQVAQLLLEESAVVTITDRHGRIQYANEKFVTSSKYSREELLGKNHRILNSGYHSEAFFKDLWDTIKSGNVWKGTIRNRAKDGTNYWVNTTIVPFMDQHGRAIQFVSIRNDVTEKKLLEEKYHLVTENIMDLIVMIDKNKRIMYSTPSSKTMLGLEVNKLIENNILDFIHKKDHPAMNTLMDSMFKGKETSRNIEFHLIKSSGEFLDVEAMVNTIVDKERNEVTQLVFVIRDVSFRKQSEQLIHQLTHYDILTGLSNRTFFLKQLSREVYKAEVSDTKLAVIFFDLDKFKNINDFLGAEAGDTLLTEVAGRLQMSIKEKGLVARIGGDEFAVLLKDVRSDIEVKQLAQTLIEHLNEPIKVNSETRTIKASLGITFYPAHGKSPDELMKRANTASDAVKKQGGNDVAVFEDSMEETSLDRILLEYEIKKAIETDQFTIDYQPKIELETGNVFGMEALVRWNHPVLGKIPPGKFIPIAEETGLINDIGELVLRKGCKQKKEWENEGYKPLLLSVNLSAKQFYDEHLVNKIKQVIEETGVDPKWLEIEVTESAFVDVDFAAAVLTDIHHLGIQLSIDDFGKGYSSFNYLKNLPVNILKIDRAFIQDLDQFETSKAIVQGIAEIAKKLNLDLIAEGIETNDQLSTLKEIGVEKGQGFLFSKPLPPQEITAFFEKDI